MKTLLWLDDSRNPFDTETDWLIFSPIGRDIKVEWVKSYDEFVSYIKQMGLPDAICFDYDLYDENLTGYDCAKYLVMYHEINGGIIPKFNIHSSNPEGRDKILNYLNNYLDNYVINKL